MTSDNNNYVTLKHNVKMPLLGIGTSHNGGYSHDAIVYALKDCGYRHIDTAKRYGCEKYIAEAIEASGIGRNEIFLTTKCWPSDYGKEKVKEAFNGSCQRLGTENLDLYLLHWPEVPTGANRKELLNETWRTLELLFDEDLVRCIGVSNFLECHLEDLLEECSVVPHVNQCEFHPFNNPILLRRYCEENHIQFEGYSPLANGAVLKNQDIINIAESLNKTCSQVVIRWNVQQKVVCIPKSTKLDRVKENSEIFDFELTNQQMTLLSSMDIGLSVIDRSLIKDKVDNPMPDGYKLKLV